MGGLVFDYLNFYLDGEISLQSTRFEVFEQFKSQAFPFPILGGMVNHQLSESREFECMFFGTYIPRFESFYEEGGKMDLKYSTFESTASIVQTFKKWRMGFHLSYRYMNMFQESFEDTNEIQTSTLTPGLRISFSLWSVLLERCEWLEHHVGSSNFGAFENKRIRNNV